MREKSSAREKYRKRDTERSQIVIIFFIVLNEMTVEWIFEDFADFGVFLVLLEMKI